MAHRRGRLLLSGFGLLVALALLEVCVRVAGAQPDVPRMEPNPYFGWRHVPQRTWRYNGRVTVHANSRGLRDREFEYPKPAGVSRILILGDSMTEGGQVSADQTFTKRLEQSLMQTGVPVEVINAGMAGFGTAHEVLFYEHEGARYQPDIVVLAFFIGNDVYDNSQRLVPTGTPGKPPAPYFVLVDGEIELRNFPCRCDAAEQQGHLPAVRRFIRQRSALYGLLGPAVIGVAPRVAGFLAQEGVMGNLSRQSSWMTRDGIPLLFFNFAAVTSSDWTDAWEVTRRLLVRLRDDVTRSGARLIIAGIPSREQVHPQLWEAAVSTYPKLREGVWDLDKPDRMLAEASASAGAPYVSLVGPLRDEARKSARLLFFDQVDEAHLTAAGHAAVAAALHVAVVEVDGRQSIDPYVIVESRTSDQ